MTKVGRIRKQAIPSKGLITHFGDPPSHGNLIVDLLGNQQSVFEAFGKTLNAILEKLQSLKQSLPSSMHYEYNGNLVAH